MARPGFDETFIRMARVLALRSTCTRLQVGCFITTVDHSRVLAVGYNGNAPGLVDECSNQGPGLCCDPLHAEENACIACQTGPEVAKHVYVTHHPCLLCAKRIIRLGGVRAVFYGDDSYRDKRGLELLARVGILTELVSPLPILGPEACNVPPQGWRCTRLAGHEGPCAAVPLMPEDTTHEAPLKHAFITRRGAGPLEYAEGAQTSLRQCNGYCPNWVGPDTILCRSCRAEYREDPDAFK